jgi:hypothetical protein
MHDRQYKSKIFPERGNVLYRYDKALSVERGARVFSRKDWESPERITLKVKLRGSFEKFCTLYVFSLKMNLF